MGYSVFVQLIQLEFSNFYIQFLDRSFTGNSPVSTFSMLDAFHQLMLPSKFVPAVEEKNKTFSYAQNNVQKYV